MFLNPLYIKGMVIKQKIMAMQIGISPSYLSLVLSGKKEISRPLAEKLSTLFPNKDFFFWRSADPSEIINSFLKQEAA